VKRVGLPRADLAEEDFPRTARRQHVHVDPGPSLVSDHERGPGLGPSGEMARHGRDRHRSSDSMSGPGAHTRAVRSGCRTSSSRHCGHIHTRGWSVQRSHEPCDASLPISTVLSPRRSVIRTADAVGPRQDSQIHLRGSHASA
jgi:hypothetical protein